jgi:hypothetical protein
MLGPVRSCWDPAPFAGLYALYPVGGTRGELENWRLQPVTVPVLGIVRAAAATGCAPGKAGRC